MMTQSARPVDGISHATLHSALRNRLRRDDPMVMPAFAEDYLIVDEVLAFPTDGNPYKLVYGQLLVRPAPRFHHQHVGSFAGWRTIVIEEA